MFFLIIASVIAISVFHAFVMRAVEGYDYSSSPKNEWSRFEAGKTGSYRLF